MKKSILLVMVILLISACKNSGEDHKVISVEDLYSISLPTFLKEGNDLHDDASLQYQNPIREFYVIVIDETKEEMYEALEENELLDIYPNDINGYSSLVIDGFEEAVDISKKSPIQETLINNMPARLYTASGNIEGMDVFYSIALIEGKDNYYQIMAWTLASRENKYKAEMERILRSFKEL